MTNMMSLYYCDTCDRNYPMLEAVKDPNDHDNLACSYCMNPFG